MLLLVCLLYSVSVETKLAVQKMNMSKKGKSTEIENRSVIVGGAERRGRGSDCYWVSAFAGMMKTFWN